MSIRLRQLNANLQKMIRDTVHLNPIRGLLSEVRLSQEADSVSDCSFSNASWRLVVSMRSAPIMATTGWLLRRFKAAIGGFWALVRGEHGFGRSR